MTADEIITGIIRREGGFSLRAADKGGATKFGITQATLATWRGHAVTIREVEALTEDEAREIYADRYLKPYALVPDPLQALLVDIAVTSWHDDAARLLQQALAVAGFYRGAVDGKAGPLTWAALAALLADGNPRSLRSLFVRILRLRSQQLIDESLDDPKTQAFLRSNPDQDIHNLRGWQNRCLEFVDALI